jgi:hypothetical protein
MSLKARTYANLKQTVNEDVSVAKVLSRPQINEPMFLVDDVLTVCVTTPNPISTAERVFASF